MKPPKKPKPRKRHPPPPLLSRLEDSARAGETAKPEHVVRICESLREALDYMEWGHDCRGRRCIRCSRIRRLEDGK